MTRGRTAIALLGLAALAGCFLFVAWFLTFDGGGIRRGDLAYYVFIPAPVRALPAHAACEEPTFASTTNDSLEAEVIKMEFTSRADSLVLAAAYARAFAAWRCRVAPSSAPGHPILLRCADPDVEVTLRTGLRSDATGCRPVGVAFRFSPS